MSTKHSKQCHRCESWVRMTAAEFAAHEQQFTTCGRCLAVITAEVEHINWNAQPREEIPHVRSETTANV